MSGAPTRSGDVRRRRTRVHPILQVLERRQVLSTFHVNTLLDTLAVNLQTGGDASGHISLRSAIMAANSSVGADTITVPAGTIILSIAGTGEDGASSGDLDLKGGLKIQGQGM